MKQRVLFLAALCLTAFATSACSDDDSSSDKKYNVGDFYYEGGIRGVVFEVFDDGRHGLLVSLDENSSLQWAIETAAPEKTGATNEEDGEDNMDVIEAIPGWRTKFPAFAWCGAKNTGGVVGWYLPAFYELVHLYNVYASDQDAFNKVLTDNGGVAISPTQETTDYWSSSENILSGKEGEAAVFGFYDRTLAFQNKAGTARVRAVHEF